MSRTPIDPSLIHDPDDDVATEAAFELLTDLVRPHLDPVVGAKITSEIRNASFTEEEVRALSRALGEAYQMQGASFSDLKKAMKEARERLRDPSSVPQEELDEMVADACDEAATVLVSSWCNVLIIEGTQNGAGISLATIDDAMLPPLDEQMAELLAQAVGQANLTVDEARGILRAVRASLAVGETIPEAMTVILQREGVVVSA